MSFSILFERAGEMNVGDFVGTEYQYDFSLQVDRVALTAIPSPGTVTVLDLVVGGQLTGYQAQVPSGVGEVSLTQVFSPPLVLPVNITTQLTPTLRWQCISGDANITTAISQVDLVMYAERLVAYPPTVIPFAGGSLLTPALTEGNVEGGTQALFAEWLGDYFDGNMHMIGVNASGVFPVCNLRFGQGEIQQPLNQGNLAGFPSPNPAQTEIRLTMTRRQERRDAWQGGWLVTAPTVLNFWVRSKNQGRGQGSYLTRTVAELVYSILNNPENAVALAQKGIKHLAPTGGRTIPSKDWSEMCVMCRADLEWVVYFQNSTIGWGAQPAPPNLPPGATFPLLFERAGEVMAGDAVGGQYELDYSVQVARAAVTAQAPAVNTVLELMVGGVATGLALTVPSGLPNTTVKAFADPALPITKIVTQAGTGRTQAITWQCASGSATAETAISQVDLVMYCAVLTS
jgi:hypothetical protein